jgi:hypothetical protein
MLYRVVLENGDRKEELITNLEILSDWLKSQGYSNNVEDLKKVIELIKEK